MTHVRLAAMGRAAGCLSALTLCAVSSCARPVQPELVPLVSADGRAVAVPARRISCPPPRYPPTVLDREYDVHVVLEFIVDTAGRADSASIRQVLGEHPSFVRSARAALLRCRFVPAQVDGHPVPMRARVTYVFGSF